MNFETEALTAPATHKKFQGDTSSIPITDVAQNLAANRKSGTLTLRRGPEVRREVRRIVFREGKIISYADNIGFSITRWMEEKGIVNQEVLKKAFQKYKRNRRKNLGDLLQDAGAMSAEVYLGHIRSLMAEMLYETFTFRDGIFEFHENELDPAAMDREITGVKLELAVGPILIEAARHLDDWEAIRRSMPSESEIYRVATGEKGEALRELAKDEVALTAVKLLDGSRNIREVIAAIPSSRFEASRAIANLVTRKWARPIDGAELLTHINATSRTPEEKTRALVQLKAGLEREPGNRILFKKVAELSQELGNREESAIYHKLLALGLLDDGDHQGAENQLRQSIKLNPKDISAWQKLYETLEARGDQQALLSTGTEMALLLRKRGLEELARDHLARMLERFPSQVQLRVAHAEALFTLGGRAEPVQSLLDLARDLLKKKLVDEAERVLAKVIKYDGENKRAREIYEKLHTGRLERERARRFYLVRATLSVLFLAAFGFFVGYDLYARREFAMTAREIFADGLIEKREYQKALSRLTSVRDRHSLSFLGLVEDDMIQALQESARRKEAADKRSGSTPPAPAPEGGKKNGK